MYIDHMVTFLGIRGLDSSVDIMECINKNMLVIEITFEFSMMNDFMYKYMHIQQAIKIQVNYTDLKYISFFR